MINAKKYNAILLGEIKNELKVVKGCACPEDSIVYECTIVGDTSGPGATVWKGTAFDCMSTSNKIVLLHNPGPLVTSQSGSCNMGTIKAQMLNQSYDRVYTSQIKVAVTADMIGENIECVYDYDNGRTKRIIGTHTITGKTRVMQIIKRVSLLL